MNVSTPRGYDGQFSDSASGLLYLRARWYDPVTAQFVSVDPALATTHQAYAYAGDDPVNGVDLTGARTNNVRDAGYQTPAQQAEKINGVIDSELGNTGNAVGVTPYVKVGTYKGQKTLLLIIIPATADRNSPILVGQLATERSTLGGASRSASTNMEPLGVCEGFEAGAGAVAFSGFGDLVVEGIAAAPETGLWSLAAVPVGLAGMAVSAFALSGSLNHGPLACNGAG